MINLSEKLGEMTFDGLITDIKPAPEVRGGVIRKLSAAATLKRGTILAKSSGTAGDGKLVVLGSTAKENETLTPDCILCDDIDVGTAADEKVAVYTAGCFDIGKVTVASAYNITEGDGFIGLTWLDSGSRSFYTANTPIRVPADLKGLKIRTMDSQIAIDMMNALGGSATVMSYSEIYTGLQQGVIDGAENNITALRDHSDVTKYYCYDEHTRIPDVIVISTKVWNQMSDSQKNIMKETAAAATDEYKTRWADFENEVKTAAEGNGITFVEDVDTAAFQEACQSIYDGLKTSNAEVYAIVEKIQAAGR